jgi:hypothetical protein
MTSEPVTSYTLVDAMPLDSPALIARPGQRASLMFVTAPGADDVPGAIGVRVRVESADGGLYTGTLADAPKFAWLPSFGERVAFAGRHTSSP